MKTVKTMFGIAFPPSAIAVSVDDVDVFADGAIEADFDFDVRRWHPEFWLYAYRVACAVAKHNGVKLLSLDGLKDIAITMKVVFESHAPENHDDDDHEPPGVSVNMRHIPEVKRVIEAEKDISPRWFLPAPRILKP